MTANVALSCVEVMDGIHRIDTPLGERTMAIYFIGDGSEYVLVDTTVGALAEEAFQTFLQVTAVDPAAVRLVLNTHADWDHVAGNGAARRLFDSALFCCHRLDREPIEDVEAMIGKRYGEFAAPHGIDETDETKTVIRDDTESTRIDILLAGGEVLRVGGRDLEVLHTPGHSHGHIALLDRPRRCAVVADAVLGDGLLTTGGKPAMPPTYRYVDEYLETIQQLEALELDLLLTAHYQLLAGPAIADFLATTRRFVTKADECVRSALTAAVEPVSLRELIDTLGPQLGPWAKETYPALAFPLSGHVEQLVDTGVISRDDTGDVVRFSMR